MKNPNINDCVSQNILNRVRKNLRHPISPDHSGLVVVLKSDLLALLAQADAVNDMLAKLNKLTNRND